LDNKTYRLLFWAILLPALALRIALASVNLDANDRHHHAVQQMIEKKSLTSYKDCAQCYHPKLFHGTAAVLQLAFKIDSEEQQKSSGQFLNVLAGMILLLILWIWLNGLTWPPLVKLLVFGLIALNPKLIAINAQYTNDTFVFLFAAIAILGTWRLMHEYGRFNMAMIAIGCIGAGLSKGSGIPLTFALLLFLSIYFLVSKRGAAMRSVLITTLLFILIVPLAGNYIQNFKDSEQVLGLNGEYSPPSSFYKKSYVDRPGVILVVHSYMTFRFIDLVKHPFIVNSHKDYAPNRTSVWSQVYGRSVSARFDQWPKSWISQEQSVLRTSRILIILGIIPLLIGLYGFMFTGIQLLKGLVERRFDKNWLSDLLMFLVIGSMIAVLLKLTWQHRDFCTMKAIYIWPGLMAILYFLGTGMSELLKKSWSKVLILPTLIALIATSSYEIISLVQFLKELP